MDAPTSPSETAMEMVQSLLREFTRRAETLGARGESGGMDWKKVVHTAVRRMPKTMALPLVRRALEQNPQNKDLWGQLVDCTIWLENRAVSEAALAGMQKASGNTVALLKLQATLAERNDRWAEALELWRQVHTRAQNAVSLRGLARCSENVGDIAGAVANLEALAATDEARPIDLYDLAILKSLLSGPAFRQEHSAAFVARYPDDLAIKERHGFLVKHVGFFGHGLGSVERLPETLEEQLDYVRHLGVRHNMPREPSLTEVDQALQSFLLRPTNVVLLERSVDTLVLSGNPAAARQLLHGIGAGEPSGRLLTLESSLEEQQGQLRQAICLQIKAARLCDRVRTLSRLIALLLKAERWTVAERIYAYLETEFKATLPGLRIVARTAYDLKKFHVAHRYFDQVQALERVERSLHRHAGALWQIGESERAWATLLSVVTRRRELISPDPNVREAGLETIRRSIEAYQARAEATKSEAGKADLVREIESEFRSPNLLKSSAINAPLSSRFVAELTRLEALGAHREAAALIEADLNRVISLTSLPQYCGDLFYRAARIYETLGEKGKALTYLERAIWHNKADELLVLHHRRLMMETSGRLSGEVYKGPAVLLLTWKGNLPMAERFARDIRRRAGFPVFVLYGDPSLETITSQERRYGHRLAVPSEDGYEFLAKKLCLAYRYLYTCTNVTAVLKTDDDGFIDDPAVLKAMISSCLAAEIPYGGRINRYMGAVYHHGHLSADGEAPRLALHAPVEYCSGFCYYLGRKGLSEIYRYSLTHFWIDNPHIMYEDVFFGEILSAAGVKPSYVDVVNKSGLFLEGFEALTLLKTMPRKSEP